MTATIAGVDDIFTLAAGIASQVLLKVFQWSLYCHSVHLRLLQLIWHADAAEMPTISQ